MLWPFGSVCFFLISLNLVNYGSVNAQYIAAVPIVYMLNYQLAQPVSQLQQSQPLFAFLVPGTVPINVPAFPVKKPNLVNDLPIRYGINTKPGEADNDGINTKPESDPAEGVHPMFGGILKVGNEIAGGLLKGGGILGGGDRGGGGGGGGKVDEDDGVEVLEEVEGDTTSKREKKEGGRGILGGLLGNSGGGGGGGLQGSNGGGILGNRRGGIVGGLFGG